MPESRRMPLPERPLPSSAVRRRIRLILDVLMIAIVLLMVVGFCYFCYRTAAGLSHLGE
jgi:hypothetical protein